ncbi:unnamed protein product [Acanthoscelides obtectus]|uniref:Uncharacterized protein n=1 Tax=Acanthoscelides obtectus TaxID=200917 RepID=A0A9P0PXR1_ACAOB|nr:unnamed protein product [Acanthoscelides obtectus]CAK1632814.1 hypothetical protein AOBTE_LOCUS7741 [Acanthoscelides obtectus]
MEPNGSRWRRFVMKNNKRSIWSHNIGLSKQQVSDSDTPADFRQTAKTQSIKEKQPKQDQQVEDVARTGPRLHSTSTAKRLVVFGMATSTASDGLRAIPMKIWMYQDNDPKHSSRLCRNYLDQQQKLGELKILTWPFQSPDLSPIEYLCDELDRQVKQQESTSAADLWANLQEAYPNLNHELDDIDTVDNTNTAKDTINETGQTDYQKHPFVIDKTNTNEDEIEKDAETRHSNNQHPVVTIPISDQPLPKIRSQQAPVCSITKGTYMHEK